MAISVYYIPFPGQANTAARMTALAASAAPNEIPKPVPTTQGLLMLHSSALRQDKVYADDGTLTTANYLSDPIYALDLPVANAQTIQAKLAADLATLETWVTNNPSGAILTAGQTLVLAKGLIGLIRIVSANTASIGQA
jgi:hypothetical protein